MAITPLPTLDRSSPTFRTEVDTFFGAQLPAFASEANDLADDVNADAVAAAASAADAATQVGLAEDQVTLAGAEADAAAASAVNAASYATLAAGSANFVGAWSLLTGALNMPASVLHDGKYWVLLQNLADVTAHTPGVSAAWANLSAGSANGKSYYFGSM